MNNTRYLLILFITLSFSKIDAAPLRPNCQTNDDKISARQIELHSIGFSSDHHLFAYLKQGYEEGIGSYYWQLTIQDVVTNKRIEHVRLFTTQEKQEQPPPQFIHSIEKLLAAHLFKTLHPPKLTHFPIEISGTLVNAYLLDSAQSEENGIRTKNIDLFLADKNFNFKRIGQLSEINFFGHLKRFDYKVAGYIADQASDNMVVVVTFNNHENEVDDLICTFALFGANSTLRELSQKDKSSFAERVVKFSSEQARDRRAQ